MASVGLMLNLWVTVEMIYWDVNDVIHLHSTKNLGYNSMSVSELAEFDSSK